MPEAPRCWHDIAARHDMERDLGYRRALIDRGIYHFPLPTKQGSISAAHTEADIDETLERTDDVLRAGISAVKITAVETLVCHADAELGVREGAHGPAGAVRVGRGDAGVHPRGGWGRGGSGDAPRWGRIPPESSTSGR